MKKLALLISLFVIMSVASADSTQNSDGNGWKLSKSGNGIKVYTRPSKQYKFPDWMAVTVMDTRLEVFLEILRDVPNYPQWMAFCKSAEIVKRFDLNNMIVHIVFDFPIVEDRDMVIKDNAIYLLHMARGTMNLMLQKNSDVPVIKGGVRMTQFDGFFQCDFITREKTGIMFRFNVDPGGNIPAPLVNIICEKIMYDSVKNIKNKMIHAKNYIASAEKSSDRVLFEGILNNREKVRAIIKARMKEYYHDYRSIDKLLNNNEVIDEFLSGDAVRLTEIVFASLGRRKNLEVAAQGAMELILKIATTNMEKFKDIPRDGALIARLIDGPKPGEKCVYDEVLVKVRDSLKDEFKNRI